MDINPELVDPDNHDYRLTATSPAAGYGCQTVLSSSNGISQLPVSDFVTLKGTKIQVAGNISQNTFWQADTVVVTDTLRVLNGITLKVKAGTRVEFTGYYPLLVQGTISAEGKADSLILFTSANPSAYSSDSTTNGAWHSIRFIQTPAENQQSLLKYCRIEYSKAVAGPAFSDHCGGAVYLENFSGLKIENCFIENNTAVYGGAVYSFYNSNPQISGSLIRNNHAYWGGAAFVNYYSFPVIANNTIVNNDMFNTSPDIMNGVVFNFLAKPHFYNNIVRDNQVFTHTQLRNHKFYYTWNNNIQGDSLLNWNIDAEPLFVSAADGDYNLSAASPCVDAGSQDLPYLTMPEKDLAGNPRIYGSQVDIGAYEYTVVGIQPETVKDWNLALTAYPNPFNPQTRISFRLNEEETLSLNILNTKGELVYSVNKQQFAAGVNSLQWSAQNQSSGIYFIRIEGQARVQSLKIMLLK